MCLIMAVVSKMATDNVQYMLEYNGLKTGEKQINKQKVQAATMTLRSVVFHFGVISCRSFSKQVQKKGAANPEGDQKSERDRIS